MLNPALALVSINMTPNSRDLASPSSIETCLNLSPNKQYLERTSEIWTRVSIDASKVYIFFFWITGSQNFAPLYPDTGSLFIIYKYEIATKLKIS